MNNGESPERLTYADAGVDIAAGNALVGRIAPLVARTRRRGVLGGIGGFGGLFELPVERYRQPVMVSGADGVGTKLRLAIELGRHDTIGIDLVAMCVNDILVTGAEPLWFLDYYASGHLDVERATAVIGGIARGCEIAGAALLGGETAEMPGLYAGEDYDLAGFAVGVVEKAAIIDGRAVSAGDVVLGIDSSGPHSNGYSLIRRLLEDEPPGRTLADGTPLGDALLVPTRIYVPAVRALLEQGTSAVHAIAHITGGGLTENLPRVLPDGTVARIDLGSWPLPAVFAWMREGGRIDDAELLRTFNCGIGMALVLAADDAPAAIETLAAHGERARVIGEIVSGRHLARRRGGGRRGAGDVHRCARGAVSARLAILISGRGSNMLAIARACAQGRLDATVAGVIADRAEATGLAAAAALGLSTTVVERGAHPDRASFERALAAELAALRPDLVVLAGFMRILGPELVAAWSGRMLNIHPSLLPRHPGLDTHARALAAGDTEHGASVHLVTAELDAGPLVAQARVPVLPGDTPVSLGARVLAEEHALYIRALARVLEQRKADSAERPSNAPSETMTASTFDEQGTEAAPGADLPSTASRHRAAPIP